MFEKLFGKKNQPVRRQAAVRRARPQLEALEDRFVPATATARWFVTEATVVNTAGNNPVSVTLQMQVNNDGDGAFLFQSHNVNVTFDPTKVQLVDVVGVEQSQLPPGSGGPLTAFTTPSSANAAGQVNVAQVVGSPNATLQPPGYTQLFATINFTLIDDGFFGALPINIVLEGDPINAADTNINGDITLQVINPDPTADFDFDLGIDNVIVVTAPFNLPPDITIPAPQNILFGLPSLTFAGNISVSDPAPFNAALPERISLTVTNGVLDLSGTAGLTFLAGDGTADATMTFEGTLANINAALNGMAYTPNGGFFGTDNLVISVNDLGNNGAGGALTTTRTLPINTVRLFLDEIMYGPPGNPDAANLVDPGLANTPNQYIEIRSTIPNFTIPTNVALAVIDSDSGIAAGNVRNRFTLAGLTTGSNGKLVLVSGGDPDGSQTGITIPDPAYSFNPNATTLESTIIAFGDPAVTGAGNINHNGDDDLVGQIEGSGAVSFLIFEWTGTLLNLNNLPNQDVDSDNDGVLDGQGVNIQRIQDAVAIGDTGLDVAYGGGFSAIVAGGADYVGRINDSTGNAAADWVVAPTVTGDGTANPLVFTGGAGTTNGLEGRVLTSTIGAKNAYLTQVASIATNAPGATAGLRQQRSQVTSVDVVFTGTVAAAGGSALADAFTLTAPGGGLVSLTATLIGGNTVRLSFNAGTHVAALSAAIGGFQNGLVTDGVYTLAINGDLLVDAAGANVDADANGAAGGSTNRTFTRLFGDADGDGDVDNSDRQQFRKTLHGLPGALPIVVFDFDHDGDVDNNDRNAFNANDGIDLTP
ncbi:MAG: hypothetical protein L0Y71_04915 [Gemmataceae bacterium]|nr:hypothetical protein [Gemmataceae bacterium]